MDKQWPEFPPLEAEDIEVKIKQVGEKGAVALLYKTARTDMNMLDKIVGPTNWRDDYREIKGNLYCQIDIWDDDKKQWVSKANCGIESREDGDGNEKKGEASDAFKRAGFLWGIGRELYSAPFTFLQLPTKAKGSGFELVDRFARFEISHIAYNDKRQITALTIVNEKTKEAVYTMGKGAPKPPKPAQEPPKPSVTPPADKPADTSAQRDKAQAESRRAILQAIGAKAFTSPEVGNSWVKGYLERIKVKSVDALTIEQFFTMKDEMQKVKANGNP
jgi:hypothetical protein